MHLTRRAVLGASAAGLALMAGCQQQDVSADLAAALERLSTNMLKDDPINATDLAVTEAQAGGRYIDRVPDLSPAGKRASRAVLETGLAELEAIDRTRLEGQDGVSYDVVATALRDGIAVAQYEYGNGAGNPYAVTQLNGAYIRVPDFLASRHPVTNRDQADAYLARLSGLARMMDQETEVIRADAAAGVMPPDFCIDVALGQLRGFASTAPAQSVVVTTFAERLGEVAEIAAADRPTLATQAETIVRDEIIPAYQRQIEALTAVRAQASHDAGMWKLPGGEEAYVAGLRNYTSTTMTPDEIHDMGVELVAQLSSEMDAILRAEGMTRGTVAERATALAARRDQLYPNTNPGREQLIADLNAQVAAVTTRMPEYFGRLAQAPLQIERVPPFIEQGAPLGYYQPAALDGSRPGTYFINLRNTAEWPRFSLPALSYHEGVPGHHWQIAIAQESEGLPFIRSALLFFGAYVEGWGLYAEQLCDEIGMFENNRLARLGYLQSAAFRSSRLVVDTGMHHKRWTREQAITSMVQATGRVESFVTKEIERYCAIPGQATSYMVGRQAINRMRDSARASLGDRFDLKGFHDTLLTNGSTPLTVTEQLVQQWVASFGQA